jgi:radical SAM protein with 4Fe4S-binding SPASM domain
MLHPQFFEFTELPGNIFSIVSTNGHFLDEENSEKLARSKLKKLIVSIDGTTQEIYSMYRRNGELEKVLTGIRNVTAARKKFKSTMIIELQFLVNRFNEHQVNDAENLARKTGAKLKLKSMQVISGVSPEEWMPVNDRFRRYKTSIKGKPEVKSLLPDRCERLWFNPVITWDGFVLPCCFDKNADFVMGDLKKESFREIWYGERYSNFRTKVFTQRSSVGICTNCTSGLKRVKY